jgi:energy-coupling factor transporter transmembrane protein EcfT
LGTRGYRGPVTLTVMCAVGVVLIIFGAVFFLQGINVLGGSGMSGKTLWAVLGPIIALVGVGILVRGGRRTT